MAVLEMPIYGAEPAAYCMTLLPRRTYDSSDLKPFPKHSYTESETVVKRWSVTQQGINKINKTRKWYTTLNQMFLGNTLVFKITG